MTIRSALVVPLTALSLAAVAAPKSSTAPGYPDWVVPVGKSQHSGREICPSDLRHKITIVAYVEGPKAKEQLTKVGFVAGYVANSFAGEGAADVSEMKISRDTIGVISILGAVKPDVFKEVMADKAFLKAYPRFAFNDVAVPVFLGEVTFAGAPVPDKYPYVIVMGPEGTEPLYKGEADAKAVSAAVAKARKDLPTWLPFYGTVTAPQGVGKSLETALKKGKPLDAVTASAKKGCLGKDPDLAKESQIIYDAIEQTRSELVHRIKIEAMSSPQCAVVDIEQLVRYWPKMKKRVEAVKKRALSHPEVAALVALYVKCSPWMRADFMCKNEAESKKIVNELNKVKKQIAPYKDSQNITVQNIALLFDLKLDDAISAMPTKVQAK